MQPETAGESYQAGWSCSSWDACELGEGLDRRRRELTRSSWEKNIHLLLSAYARLPSILPAGTLPKLVFVGDGPARAELEGICEKQGYDAVFMGQRVGEELARCFASADVFAFPSFTEVRRSGPDVAARLTLTCRHSARSCWRRWPQVW